MNCLTIVLFVFLVTYSNGSEPNDGLLKEICAGCPSDAKNNPEIKKIIKSILPEFDSRSNYANRYKLNVVEATQQVVAGTLYKINADLIYTDCCKESKSDIELCNELSDPKMEKCKISIWNKPSIPREIETTVKCNTVNFNFTSTLA